MVSTITTLKMDLCARSTNSQRFLCFEVYLLRIRWIWLKINLCSAILGLVLSRSFWDLRILSGIYTYALSAGASRYKPQFSGFSTSHDGWYLTVSQILDFTNRSSISFWAASLMQHSSYKQCVRTDSVYLVFSSLNFSSFLLSCIFLLSAYSVWCLWAEE